MSGRSVLDEAIAGSGRARRPAPRARSSCSTRWPIRRAPTTWTASSRASARCRRSTSTSAATRSRAQAREVLHGLGFDDERIDGDVGALSGGWKMRVAMARVLLGRPDVLLMDEPTNHLDIESIIWLESVPEVAARRAADDLARPRVHEPHRHAGSPRSTAAKSPPTPATTTSTSASARSARPTARRPTRASRRCSPRSSASSTGSRRTPPRRRRCRAASRRSRRSRRSSCRRSGSVVKFDFRHAAALRRAGRGARGRHQGVRPARRPRRPEPDHPPRRALVRDGEERRRQVDAAEDGRRRAGAGRRRASSSARA